MPHFSAALWLVDLRVGEKRRFCECDETHGVVGTRRRDSERINLGSSRRLTLQMFARCSDFNATINTTEILR
jgi:hypothetical protein